MDANMDYNQLDANAMQSWNLEGANVKILKDGISLQGLVTNSRVKYGGKVQHSMNVFDSVRKKVNKYAPDQVLFYDENIIEINKQFNLF